ncbi:hypothetical protein YPPY47_1848, partial [Yersinia pestis PY-47]
MDKSVVLQRER